MKIQTFLWLSYTVPRFNEWKLEMLRLRNFEFLTIIQELSCFFLKKHYGTCVVFAITNLF